MLSITYIKPHLSDKTRNTANTFNSKIEFWVLSDSSKAVRAVINRSEASDSKVPLTKSLDVYSRSG